MSVQHTIKFPEIVKSKEFVYFLGFLWADGYISSANNSIEINIVRDDYIELDPVLSRHIQWNIFYKQRRTKNGISYGRPQVKIQKSLPDLKQFLLESNYQNKSGGSPSSILSEIPHSLSHYWWRGYFDGDGSIALSKNGCRNLSFWSTHDQDWTELSKLMTSLGVTFNIYFYTRKCGNSSSLTISHKDKIRKVRSYLYPQGIYDFGLKRKFDKLMMV